MSTKRLKTRRSNLERSHVATEVSQIPPTSQIKDPTDSARWWREVVESIAIAIILALLFRTFEAEAFVIPTGSMAPTLQGRHHDIACAKCAKRFQVGASKQNVNECICPMCQFDNPIQVNKANHAPFSGDRILVNKFLYQFSEPKRWDVIVFKYPGNAKQNYIKRLVGLPGETIRIRHGDLYSRSKGEDNFRILRKPAGKVRRLLHCVHDTKCVPPEYLEADWPLCWNNDPAGGPWLVEDQKHFRLDHTGQDIAWLRYQHLRPNPIFDPNNASRRVTNDWGQLSLGKPPRSAASRNGQLITDVYAYNDFDFNRLVSNPNAEIHWVGDLALECLLRVKSDAGEILLDLVEGGRHHRCNIDVSTGKATLTLANGAESFVDDETGDSAAELTAKTKIRGHGKYRIFYANIDNQLWLWINNRLVTWNSLNGPHSGTFQTPSDLNPKWTVDDAGDLRPVGIGGRNIDIEAKRLRVYRDNYYIAASAQQTPGTTIKTISSSLDYIINPNGEVPLQNVEIRRALGDPTSWEDTRYFRLRQTAEFKLEAGQYFVLGDNSPQSKDARLWHGPAFSHIDDRGIRVKHCVTRDMLIGKAFFVYWPHPWRLGSTALPIIPNIPGMGRIK